MFQRQEKNDKSPSKIYHYWFDEYNNKSRLELLEMSVRKKTGYRAPYMNKFISDTRKRPGGGIFRVLRLAGPVRTWANAGSKKENQSRLIKFQPKVESLPILNRAPQNDMTT
jgi:hypothetical protein